MSGRIRRSFHLYGAARRVSFARTLSSFLAHIHPPSSPPATRAATVEDGGVPRMCVEAKAHHGGVGYQTRSRLPSAALTPPPPPSPPLSVFLFFVSSSTVHIPSSLASLLAASSACILPDCLIFSFFSFAVHLLRPLSFPLPLFVAAAILRHM